MSFNYTPGIDIAQSDARYLVNTVNCKGAMGAGVALAIKKRFPEIEGRYKEACTAGKLLPGGLMVSPTKDGRAILNIATKDHYWTEDRKSAPSRYEWAGYALLNLNRWLVGMAPEKGRVAMPLPGGGHGQLDQARIARMCRTYLAPALEAGFDIDLISPEFPLAEDPVFYAGVGSRDTPTGDIADLMREMAGMAAEDGWLLRSGGATGADTFFHEGALAAGVKSEIFRHNRKFNGPEQVFETRDVHYRLAISVHPAATRLSEWALGQHARNGCQVFGPDFTVPSSIVICWTKDGGYNGGTAQAMRYADLAGIPILNLGKPELQGISATDAMSLARNMIADRHSRIGQKFNTAREVDTAPQAGSFGI